MTIKQKIIQELENPKIPDLKFLFSDEVLDLAPEVLEELLLEEKKDFDELLKTLDNEITFEIFQDFSRLDLFFSLLNHLQNVNSSEKVRNIIEDFEPKYVDFWNYISFNKRYYEMLVYCRKNCELDEEQKRILDVSIKWYEIKWINLPVAKQKNLKEISKKLSELAQKFWNNVLFSEKEFYYVFETDEAIKEIPKNDLEEAKNKAKNKWKTWYLFDSSLSSYQSIMKYCSDNKIREHFFTEKHNFASSGEYDNRKIVLEILKLRQKEAKILWYKNYAELSLEFKMADTPKNIIKLINTVSKKAKKKALKEIETLKNYFNLSEINTWDLTYYSRIYKEKEFNFDERELKKYFEFDKVLNWLFEISKRLYWIEMKEIKIDSYCGDLKIYEVYKDGKHISYFIGDYFYNENKRSWAWCDNLRPKVEENIKHKIINNLLPIIINVCAFQKWEKGKTLLNYIDVETMFHEFWHALHEMLSKSKYSDLSWFNVEWDFVELPSQIMENWCSDEEALKLFAKHFETWKDLPKKTLKTMKMLKKYWTWNFILRQNEFASVDMHLHSKKFPDNIEDLDLHILELAKNTSIFELKENYKKYASFSHIFDWGYAAWYYSYMRAEIIEAQVWEVFKKNGIFNKETANKFLDTILSAWSRKKAKELFFDFAWLDISPKAFLKRKGI